MWRIIWYFLGMCRVRIAGGSPEWTLKRLANARIAFRDAKKEDEFSCMLTILKKDIIRAEHEAHRSMCDLEVLSVSGFQNSFHGLFHRPLLLALLGFSAAAAIFVPKFVFFYEVTGNERVETADILRNLQELGVGFGTYGPSIHPQELKNQMLVRIPELQWLTIQQNGMCASVVVRERPETEQIMDRRTPQDVVSSRSGVITTILCLDGNCLVQSGQAVTAGELLVSAYTDYGYKTQVCAALAEVYAETMRKSTCVVPDTVLCKRYTRKKQMQISFIVGRKRWTVFSSDGLTSADCDKMTTYHPFRLPGGILLPLGIEITRISEYDTSVEAADEIALLARLRQDVADYEQKDMIAGQILSVKESFRHEGSVWMLESSLQCEEMIARMQPARFTKDGLQ